MNRGTGPIITYGEQTIRTIESVREQTNALLDLPVDEKTTADYISNVRELHKRLYALFRLCERDMNQYRVNTP